MAMPTDAERRAVARGLRELSRCVFCPENTYELLADAFGVDDFEDTSDLFNRLADLIEPETECTCSVESSSEYENDGCYSWFKYELSCGHEVKSECQLPPSYCPECGKKVLYDIYKYL